MISNDNIYKKCRIEYNMANTLISIRMPDDLLRDINIIVKSQGYSNSQEFLRAAAREMVRKEKLANAAIELNKLYGSAKNKKVHLASKEKLDMLARKNRN
jgi:Arc/MetJ-type ribon-helix-helix transcriptional regulator